MRRVIGVWDGFIGIGLAIIAIMGFIAGDYDIFVVGILLVGIMLIVSGWLIFKNRKQME